MFPPQPLQHMLNQQTEEDPKQFYLSNFKTFLTQQVNYKIQQEVHSYKAILEQKEAEIKKLRDQLLDAQSLKRPVKSGLNNYQQGAVNQFQISHSDFVSLQAVAAQSSGVQTSQILEAKSILKSSQLDFPKETPKKVQFETEKPKSESKIPILAPSDAFDEQKDSKLYQEYLKLKKQLDSMGSKLESSQKFLEQSCPKFPAMNDKMTFEQKFQLLQHEFDKTEQQNFKQSQEIHKLESQNKQLNKQVSQLQTQIKKLTNEIDQKDLQLLQYQQSIVIDTEGLDENLKHLRNEMNKLKIKNKNEKIAEVLGVITEVCYGQFTEEFKAQINSNAKDFEELRKYFQNNVNEEMETKIYNFLCTLMKENSLNEHKILIDGQQRKLGTQFAQELLTGLLVGYDFAGNDEIPQLQQIRNGLAKNIQIGFME